MGRERREPDGRTTRPTTKGDRTRAFIVEQAAEAYNVLGFAGLSIAEILARTKLEKGGFYNHFKSKDELALAAFDHLIGKIRGRIDRDMAAAGESAAARLLAMANVYSSVPDERFMRGGCPILNTATEADDTHPALRARARDAMASWHDLVRRTLESGVARGEFAGTIDAHASATVVIAALEGGVLMAKLYRDSAYVRSVATFVRGYVASLQAGAGD